MCFLTELALASEDVQMGGQNFFAGDKGGFWCSFNEFLLDFFRSSGWFGCDLVIFDHFGFLVAFWWSLDKLWVGLSGPYTIFSRTISGSVYQGNSGTTKSGLFLAKIIRPIYNVIFEADFGCQVLWAVDICTNTKTSQDGLKLLLSTTCVLWGRWRERERDRQTCVLF